MKTLNANSKLSEALDVMGECFGETSDTGQVMVFDEGQAAEMARSLRSLGRVARALERTAGPHSEPGISREFPSGVVDIMPRIVRGGVDAGGGVG